MYGLNVVVVADFSIQLALVNAYVLDPARIAPSRSDPNSNGHFPFTSHPNQTGTPRGFSLNNMPYFHGSPASLPGAFQGLPGFMGMHHVGSWNGAAGMGGGGDSAGLHQPGVIRRGAGGRHNNRPGPYDRRGSRYGPGAVAGGGASGRLSPIRGMPGMYGGVGGVGGRFPMNAPGGGMPYIPPGHPAAKMMPPGPFPDAMGGVGGNAQQGMGPREAVQGRSLKSYEDLDAVGGAGSGELNY